LLTIRYSLLTIRYLLENSNELPDRLDDILSRMQEARLDLVIGLHDGAHFIEKPNPVMVLSDSSRSDPPRRCFMPTAGSRPSSRRHGMLSASET